MISSLLAFLILWPFGAYGIARALVVNSDLTQADAVFVFGGAAAYIERTRMAAQLYQEGRAPQIILTNDGQKSGWSERLQRNPFYVERAVEELQRAGVPAKDINVLPQTVSSTHEEALLLSQHATTHQLKAILIVTSAYHSRRALWTVHQVFRGSNVVIGLKHSPVNEETPYYFTWWTTAKGWHEVAGEYIKLAYYFLHYC